VGCEADAPQDFLNNQSGNYARTADNLWDLTFGIAVVVFVIVEGALVFTLLKFRQRPGREANQFHGNTKVEVILTIIPSLILAGIAVPTVQTIFENDRNDPNALQINVVARQFWWEYRYGDLEVVTANEMHIPVGQPINLTLEGVPGDVIHSFWIPRLAGTQDVVPGRLTKLNFTALETGVYLGQCKEFCGLSHANMRLKVIVDEPGDFEAWVAAQKEPSAEPGGGLAAEGRETFLQSACAGCHAIGGTDAAGQLGPNLTHFASRGTFAGATFDNTTENLTRWISDAPSMKPGVLMPAGVDELGLTPEQVEAIVAYLETLE
jgi:cytochrome c oxidase subunit 2